MQDTLPSSIQPGTTAARTYLYWQRAAGELKICTDEQRLIRERGRLRHSFGIGQPVKEALGVIPTAGVDPQAVKSVRQITTAFDGIHNSLMSLGSSGIKIAFEQLSGSDGAENDDPTGLKAASGSIFSVYTTFKNMHQIGVSTDAALETTRVALIKRYSFELPQISIFIDGQIWKSSVFAVPAGPCIFSVDPGATQTSNAQPQGPSFDCARASTQVETLICKDPKLTAEERQMSDDYHEILQRLLPEQIPVFRREHAKWFWQYSRTCNLPMKDAERKDCIGRFLSERTRQLETDFR